jgi:hypothetical protein
MSRSRPPSSLSDAPGAALAPSWRDVGLPHVQAIYEAARIKPAVVHVESHPYLPEWELLQYCQDRGIVLQAFAALGHSSDPNVMADPIIVGIAKRVKDAVREITEGITTRVRFNPVVKTGVPGFIPRVLASPHEEVSRPGGAGGVR